MVDLARERVPEGDVRVHDLTDPLSWLPDGSVDVTLLALAIEYVDDRVGCAERAAPPTRTGGIRSSTAEGLPRTIEQGASRSDR